jgi:hypothetical protein
MSRTWERAVARRAGPVICAVLLGLLPVATARAQNITIGAPFQTINEGYSEFYGLGFQLSGPGFFFNNGGPGPFPPFGPPVSGAQFGGQGQIGNLNYNWNLRAAQGSSRTYIAQAPMLTVSDGAGGFISHGSVRPFVTGIIPVVGDYPTIPAYPPTFISPIDLALQRLRATGAAGSLGQRKSNDIETGPPLPPLPQGDDPPLLLNGRGTSKP